MHSNEYLHKNSLAIKKKVWPCLCKKAVKLKGWPRIGCDGIG